MGRSTEQVCPIPEQGLGKFKERHHPITACANAVGTTDWGAFNAEGCTYAYDCAVDVANWSAKENEEAGTTPDNPESRWHEICRDHEGEPKDTCPVCFTETGDEDDDTGECAAN